MNERPKHTAGNGSIQSLRLSTKHWKIESSSLIFFLINRFVRQFLVSWISVLDSVPDSCTVRFLPEFLDPLFTILADPRFCKYRYRYQFWYHANPSPEISSMCNKLLEDFLGHITDQPDQVDFGGMIGILITWEMLEKEETWPVRLFQAQSRHACTSSGDGNYMD